MPRGGQQALSIFDWRSSQTPLRGMTTRCKVFNTLKRVLPAREKCIIQTMRRRNQAHTRRLLARNLRQLRLQRSWSQYDLADEARLRQALISALEVGTANPTLKSLDQIAAALGVEVAALFAAPPAKAG